MPQIRIAKIIPARKHWNIIFLWGFNKNKNLEITESEFWTFSNFHPDVLAWENKKAVMDFSVLYDNNNSVMYGEKICSIYDLLIIGRKRCKIPSPFDRKEWKDALFQYKAIIAPPVWHPSKRNRWAARHHYRNHQKPTVSEQHHPRPKKYL